MCGPFVRCPACNNNCCNATYGTQDNGAPCTVCPDAYKVQAEGPPDDFKRTEAYIRWSTEAAWEQHEAEQRSRNSC